jgi:hypothetical protein
MYVMSIWYILRPFGIFYGYLVYFLVIWYIFDVLVCCSKKNLATLVGIKLSSSQSAIVTAAKNGKTRALMKLSRGRQIEK